MSLLGSEDIGALRLHAGRMDGDGVLLTLRPDTSGLRRPLLRGVAVADAAGRIISHNRLFPRVLGADDGAGTPPLAGRLLSSLMAAADGPAVEEALRTLRVQAGATLSVRAAPAPTPTPTPTPTGAGVPTGAGTPADAEGPALQLRLAWLSASDEVVVEAIAAARGANGETDAGSLSDLAAGIAHDFNNLLTVIQANLREASLLATGEAAPMIANAERAVQSAAALSRRLMALGRARDSARGRWGEAVAVGPLLADLASLLRESIDARVSLEVSASSRLRVRSSRAELVQVLLNLAVNGAEAMPSGGRLQIVASAEPEEGMESALDALPALADGYVWIQVRDARVGMDAATAARALEPYFSTKGAGGTGLGLAMAQQIVREQGGRLLLRSQPGQGTTVTVVLAAAEVEPGDGASPARPPASAGTASVGTGSEPDEPVQGTRVLVVDDRAEIRAACGAILRDAGYAVEDAGDGTTALATASWWRPALVVMDAALPGLSGPATYEALLRSAPGVRAVFISGFDREALSGLEPSARWTFVPKPFDRETLLGAVARVLGAVEDLAS